MNRREQEPFTDDQVREMAERVFGATVWPTNRGTDGKKSERKSPPNPAPVSEPDAGRQPGGGRDGARIIEVDGKRFIARDAGSVLKASSSRATSSRIPGRK